MLNPAFSQPLPTLSYDERDQSLDDSSINKYFLSIMMPNKYGGVKVPDYNVDATTTKKILLSTNVQVPTNALNATPNILFIFTPHNLTFQLQVWVRWPSIGITNWAFWQNLRPTEELSVNYSRARLVSAMCNIQSASIATGGAPLQGTIDAVAYQELFPLAEGPPPFASVLPYTTDEKSMVASLPSATGVVMLAIPDSQSELSSCTSTSIVTGESSWYNFTVNNSFFNPAGATVRFVLPQPIFGSLAINGQFEYNLNSSVSVQPTNIRLTLFTRTFNSTTNTVSDVQVYTAILSSCDPQQPSGQGNQFNTISYTYVNDPWNGPITSFNITLVGPATTSLFANFNVADLEGEARGFIRPGCAAVINNPAPASLLTVGGTFNYEVVPNANLSKDLKITTGASYVQPKDIHMIKRAMSRECPDPRVKLIYALDEYNALCNERFFEHLSPRNTLKNMAFGSYLGPLMMGALKYGPKLIKAAGPVIDYLTGNQNEKLMPGENMATAHYAVSRSRRSNVNYSAGGYGSDEEEEVIATTPFVFTGFTNDDLEVTDEEDDVERAKKSNAEASTTTTTTTTENTEDIGIHDIDIVTDIEQTTTTADNSLFVIVDGSSVLLTELLEDFPALPLLPGDAVGANNLMQAWVSNNGFEKLARILAAKPGIYSHLSHPIAAYIKVSYNNIFVGDQLATILAGGVVTTGIAGFIAMFWQEANALGMQVRGNIVYKASNVFNWEIAAAFRIGGFFQDPNQEHILEANQYNWITTPNTREVLIIAQLDNGDCRVLPFVQNNGFITVFVPQDTNFVYMMESSDLYAVPKIYKVNLSRKRRNKKRYSQRKKGFFNPRPPSGTGKFTIHYAAGTYVGDGVKIEFGDSYLFNDGIDFGYVQKRMGLTVDPDLNVKMYNGLKGAGYMLDDFNFAVIPTVSNGTTKTMKIVASTRPLQTIAYTKCVVTVGVTPPISVYVATSNLNAEPDFDLMTKESADYVRSLATAVQVANYTGTNVFFFAGSYTPMGGASAGVGAFSALMGYPFGPAITGILQMDGTFTAPDQIEQKSVVVTQFATSLIVGTSGNIDNSVTAANLIFQDYNVELADKHTDKAGFVLGCKPRVFAAKNHSQLLLSIYGACLNSLGAPYSSTKTEKSGKEYKEKIQERVRANIVPPRDYQSVVEKGGGITGIPDPTVMPGQPKRFLDEKSFQQYVLSQDVQRILDAWTNKQKRNELFTRAYNNWKKLKSGPSEGYTTAALNRYFGGPGKLNQLKYIIEHADEFADDLSPQQQQMLSELEAIFKGYASGETKFTTKNKSEWPENIDSLVKLSKKISGLVAGNSAYSKWAANRPSRTMPSLTPVSRRGKGKMQANEQPQATRYRRAERGAGGEMETEPSRVIPPAGSSRKRSLEGAGEEGPARRRKQAVESDVESEVEGGEPLGSDDESF